MIFPEKLYFKEKKEKYNKSEQKDKIYIEINKEIDPEKIKEILNEIKKYAPDMASIVSQNLTITTNPKEKTTLLIVNPENYSHIANFKEGAQEILEKIKEQVEKEN